MRAWIDRNRDSLIFALSVAAVVLGVLVAWRRGVVSFDWLKDNKDSVGTACSLVSATVLVLGAVASYLRFFRGRTLSLRAELGLSVTTHPTTDGRVLHAIKLTAKNVGNATIWNPVPELTLQVYGPPGTQEPEPILKWSDELTSAEGFMPVIEPGETVMFFAVRPIAAAAWAVSYAAMLRADHGDRWHTSHMASNPQPKKPDQTED